MEAVDAISKAVTLIRSARNLAAFTGAGISTASGIPDFRSPNSGLWEAADPMLVASIFGFRANPGAFFDWVRPLAKTILDAKPNPAHMALAHLERIGILKAVITQNIDMLHQRAGNQIVYELHGHFREATCTHCFRTFDGEAILQEFLRSRDIPRCDTCNSVLKPNVILFGEQLPIQALRHAQDAAKQADVLLIIGSSLEVAPASEIPLLARRHGAKIVIINLEQTLMDGDADVVFHQDAAQLLPELIRGLEQAN